MNKFCGEMSELFPLLLIIITKLEKDVMLIMLRAWDKDKISESPTGFEPMTYSKKSDAPTTELRETGGEQGHTQGNDTTVKIRFFELPDYSEPKLIPLDLISVNATFKGNGNSLEKSGVQKIEGGIE